jgi:hypothetical protein
MRLPDFLLIGASKAGTTTLYEYLRQHPQVYMTTPKSLSFFSRDEIYAQGINWYASFFQEAEPNQVCGEASPDQTHWPQFPKSSERIAQWLPNAKFIYIMRHPVERAYSQYVQEIKGMQTLATALSSGKLSKEEIKFKLTYEPQLKVPESFEESIKKHEFILETSNYIKQIELYLRFFKKESFIFLLMEDLIQYPLETMGQVFEFIGVDNEINLVGNKPIAANQASTHAEWFVRSRINAPLRAIPGSSIAKALLSKEIRDRIYKILKQLFYSKQVENKYLPKPMLPETRQILLERFREPNQRLAEFLNRDLSHWNK